MTATTIDRGVPQTAARPGHIWRIVRLHFVNPAATIGIPWLIMGLIFAVNITLWAIIVGSVSGQDRADAQEGLQYSGSSFYIFVYMLVVAIQAVNLTFPFALGYGVTRRHFYLGTSLTFVLLSIGYGLALTLLSYIEEWTHGWGLGGHMFTAIYFGNGPVWQRLFVFAVGLMFFFFVGMMAATLWVRWKMYGLLAAGAVLALLVIGGVALATVTKSWPSVGSWFAAAGPVGVVAALLVPTAVSAVVGFFILRWATPKN